MNHTEISLYTGILTIFAIFVLTLIVAKIKSIKFFEEHDVDLGSSEFVIVSDENDIDNPPVRSYWTKEQLQVVAAFGYEGLYDGYKMGYSIEDIASILERSVASVEAQIRKSYYEPSDNFKEAKEDLFRYDEKDWPMVVFTILKHMNLDQELEVKLNKTIEDLSVSHL